MKMTYQETVEYLYNQLPVFQKIGGSAYKEGLENSLALDAYFDHPHRSYKTIHVAGTNGKGSTSHTLAAILQQSGYKVGLYTSPHLVDFRERIRVNGEMIDHQYVVDFVEEYKSGCKDVYPSFFELTMTMAFKYFEKQNVDVAVVEVGLGGRLDSTNIITPDLSVITNIGLDHVQFLGSTLEGIAGEKAGIMKPGIPIVVGEAQSGVRQVFEDTAEKVGAPIVFAEDVLPIISCVQKDGGWLYDAKRYPELKGELGGYAQVKNTATILCAVEQLQVLGYTILSEAVYAGFAHVAELTGLMGRWQVVQEANPRIICDTGHNAAGMLYIASQLKDERYKVLRIVIGMVNDKDITSVLELLPKGAVYYFTKANIPRSLNEEEFKKAAADFNLNGNAYSSVVAAINAAKRDASNSDLIFIGGSNFVVAEALGFLL